MRHAEEEPQALSVQRLCEWLDFQATNPWTDGHLLDREIILAYIADERFNPTPYPFGQPEEADWTLDDHLARIAYLAAHQDEHSDPIHVEVDQHGEGSITDGNHRLAAAWATGGTVILVDLFGFTDAAPTWLTVAGVGMARS